MKLAVTGRQVLILEEEEIMHFLCTSIKTKLVQKISLVSSVSLQEYSNEFPNLDCIIENEVINVRP